MPELGNSGVRICLCGLKLPSHLAIRTRRCRDSPPPPSIEPPPEDTPTVMAQQTTSTPTRAHPQPKKKPAPSSAKAKIQKWLPEVGKRLRGVPRFVAKEALRLYGRALKETKRQGCTDWGLALASLDRVLRTNQLEITRQELCQATAVGGKIPSVKLEQLEACVKVVARVTRQGACNDAVILPSPLAAHFASMLCEELQPKGGW